MRCNALAETLIIEDIIHAFAADVAHCLKETLFMRRYDSIAILYPRQTSTVGIGCATDRCDYDLPKHTENCLLSAGKAKSNLLFLAEPSTSVSCAFQADGAIRKSYRSSLQHVDIHCACWRSTTIFNDATTKWLWCCSPVRQSRRRDVLTNV